ncbi:MAG: FG-GAP-like repeat-containing protein [Bacteroidota bacterium]
MTLKQGHISFFCLLISLVLVSKSVTGQTFTAKSVRGLDQLSHNNGMAVADFNRDGHLDVFVVANRPYQEIDPTTWSRLYQNQNDGTFKDITVQAGLQGILSDIQGEADIVHNIQTHVKHGVSWGDYNNDGFPDLFLSNYKINKLLRNNGDGTFQDVTTSVGLAGETDCYTASSAWFDFNNDGFLDLVQGHFNECSDVQLYISNGATTFTPATNAVFEFGTIDLTWTILPLDVNEDGWVDLYFSNDFDDSKVLINESGVSFRDGSDDFGLVVSGYDMGIACGDVNNDGNFDYYITDIGENNLLLEQNGQYSNIAEELAVDDALWAWQTRLADMDLDGDEDILVANGYELAQRNFYFRNDLVNDVLKFTDQSASSGFDLSSNTRCFETFDFDHDGDLDILMTDINDTPVLLENDLIIQPAESDPHWVQISLQGVSSNRDAIGASVSITTPDGKKQHRYYTGVSFLAQSLQPVHFGLSDAIALENLTIKWPSGLIESFDQVPVDTYLHVTEGFGYELTPRSSNKIPGCTDPNSCNYNPLATIDDGSCAYLASSSINGSTDAGQLSRETYSYNQLSGSTLIWSVEGGEIVSGQGSSSIEVHWGIGTSGSVSLIESTECSSLPVTLEVALILSSIDEDISIARIWNEVLLQSIRGDFARPTVHARNLFHVSAAMWDVWSVFDNTSIAYLPQHQLIEFPMEEDIANEALDDLRKEAISYASYRLLRHRFLRSPSQFEMVVLYNRLMEQLGYDIGNISTDFSTGNAAALGNYIAQQYIDFGRSDGAAEDSDYGNSYYVPTNDPLILNLPGSQSILDPNRWQPLSFDTFIDQSGNVVEGNTPGFLSPEWGNVKSFALSESDLTTYTRNEDSYRVFHDPGAPPFLGVSTDEYYKWGFSLVSVWGSHLDPNDGVSWDISPASIGNIDIGELPENWGEHSAFYDLFEGGDIGKGRAINPVTNEAYQTQLVPRGDYARVLAEFWADGPDSETPPGHWFTILNYVSDHPLLEKKFRGEGETLSDLEWDIKAYFTLGGAVHDAAISAWSVKGWYDYIRPISAIRYMADKGQSSDQALDNYHEEGIPLMEGYVEIVQEEDPLAGRQFEYVGKVKLKTWKGHEFIQDTETDQAGVGWILAENWWPYQRPSFVTPPFAGYVSGHSTFSRAAAEVMTLITGSEYFPGGMGEFVARKNAFLVFEEGPSVDVTLQWATYRDASDQCSLSRIWGGIHPPADDIPGRQIGEIVGKNAFNKALTYFNARILSIEEIEEQPATVYPNPAQVGSRVTIRNIDNVAVEIVDLTGRSISVEELSYDKASGSISFIIPLIKSGLYFVKFSGNTIKLYVSPK